VIWKKIRMHGATDEKPRELYETRLLTQEKVGKFNIEDECFFCHKRVHIAIDCQDKKSKKNVRTRKPRPRKGDLSRQRAASCRVRLRLQLRLMMRPR
jgi:hypothetical protein